MGGLIRQISPNQHHLPIAIRRGDTEAGIQQPEGFLEEVGIEIQNQRKVVLVRSPAESDEFDRVAEVSEANSSETSGEAL